MQFSHLDNMSCPVILCRNNSKHTTRNFAARLSGCMYPPFSLKGKRGDTQHPSLWKERGFESIPSPHNGRVWGGWGEDGWGGTAHTHSWGRELHLASPDQAFHWRAHSFEPSLLYMWIHWQGHKYLRLMSCCSPQTGGASPRASVWAR